MGAVVFPLIRQEQYAMVIAPLVFSVLSIVAVALHLTTRRLAHRRPDSSDYTLIAALVLSLGHSGLTIADCLVGGAGLHITEVLAIGGTPSTALFGEIGLSIQVLWSTTVTLVKISILLLCCKIFAFARFVWAARLVGLMCIGYTLGTGIAALALCQPVTFGWDRTIEGGHFGNLFLSYILTESINIATDVLVLTLPVPSLAGLEMALCKRLVLIATFACGLLTCVIGALRLRALVLSDFDDYTFSIADAMTYSAIEPSLAIVLACVPTLRPLLPNGSRRTDGGERSGTGQLSLKWRMHPTLLTFGGSGKPTTSGSRAIKKNSIRIEDDIETNSQFEHTLRPGGGGHTVGARGGPRRQESNETMGASTSDTEDNQGIEMNVRVKKDWKVESRPQDT